MSKNMLHINVSKSCYMVFTPEHGPMTCARARTYDMNKESNLYLCGTRLILELVVKLVHIYGLGEKKCPLPTYTFMCATVTTIVTI